MVDGKKTKSHENAIYAIKHNLKRLTKYYKEVSQVSNFNKYIALHKEYVQIRNEIDEFLKVDRTSKELRNFYYKKEKSTKANSASYSFPNLYHYAVIELKKDIEAEYEKVNKKIPLYSVELFGTNKTVSNDGAIRFKTAEGLHYSCHSRYSGDTDFGAYFIFRGERYYPSNKEDCYKYFKIIEDGIEIKESLI